MQEVRYNPKIHHRKSIRLKGYDYSQNGTYFVTLCTQNREYLFGKIEKDEMVLNEAGKGAQLCWYEIPKHYPYVVLDTFIVMPNHIHGIIMIDNPVGANNHSPLQSGTSKTIGAIVRGYKIGVTKLLANYSVWQRNYYEHIIRNENSLNIVREYIITNPQNWEKDELYK